ncbi:MAG: sensor histidine kinase [Acidobacteria bacterium]|nr:sensor histidine kinase [Acidobacteriota bacterium]
MTIRQLFAEIKVPLQRALELLRPNFKQIDAAWRERLASVGVKPQAADVLAPLMLHAQEHNLRAQSLDNYKSEVESLGKVLERSGVSEADAAAAFTFYLECCLPYLSKPKERSKEPAAAVARLIAVSQFLALTSYAREWVGNWRKLQERERHSISRDLHDDIGHNLLVLKLYLEMMSNDLKKGDIAPLQAKLEEALALVSYAVESVRRLMLDMGPAMLAQFGFMQALRIYARQFTLRTGIQVKLEEANMPATLPSSYETALYRVLQGALSNVVQHSQAKNVHVTLGAIKRSVLFMSIEDDGIGFDLATTVPRRVFGLTAMRERIETLGGKFHMEAWPQRPGSRKHGTRIEVDLPLGGNIE